MQVNDQVTALVPVASEGTSEETPKTADETPLSRFIDDLRQMYEHPEKRQLAGALIWQAVSVDQIVYYGLWAVMVSVSKKIKEPMNTERQAIEGIAPRLTRVVNAGLVLKYDSTEEAATAFDKEVIQVARQAIDLGYRPGMVFNPKDEAKAWKALVKDNTRLMSSLIRGQKQPASGPLYKLWLYSSRLFFAGLVKAARENREEVLHLVKRLEEGNVLGRRTQSEDDGFGVPGEVQNEVVLIAGTFSKTSVDFVTLDLPLTPVESDIVSSRSQQVKDYPKYLRRLLRHQAVLSLLPVRPAAIPGSAMVDTKEVLVEEHWLNTQIFLTVIQAPDKREHIQADEYIKAVTELRGKTDEEVLTAFFDRMTRRGMTVTDPVDQQSLEGIVGGSLKGLRSWKKDINIHNTVGLIFVMGKTQYSLTPDEALRLVTREETTNFERMVDGYSNQEIEQFLQVQVIDGICWDEVSAVDFLAMVDAGVVPLIMLIDGLRQMPADQQPVAALLESEDMSTEILDKLLEHDLVELDLDLVARFHDLLAPRWLEQYLTGMSNSGLEDLSTRVMVQILFRVRSSWLRRFVQIKRHRFFVREHMFGDILKTSGTVRRAFSPEEITYLRQAVGDEFWRICVVSYEVGLREAEYLDFEEGKPYDIVPRWEDLPRDEVWLVGISKEVEITVPELVDTINQYTEEEVFAWRIAGDRNKKKLLADFKTRRDNFFRSL